MYDCTPRTLHAVTALSIETSEDAFLEVIQGELFAGFILDQGDDLPTSWVKLTLAITRPQGVKNRDCNHSVAALVNGGVRHELEIQGLKLFTVSREGAFGRP